MSKYTPEAIERRYKLGVAFIWTYRIIVVLYIGFFGVWPVVDGNAIGWLYLVIGAVSLFWTRKWPEDNRRAREIEYQLAGFEERDRQIAMLDGVLEEWRKQQRKQREENN